MYTHNCKIKDISLNLELKTIELNKINKLSRTIVNIKKCIRKVINAPDRVKIIKLSNHSGGEAKKDLTKDILTEINFYKGKQVIKVRTDINRRMLQQI